MKASVQQSNLCKQSTLDAFLFQQAEISSIHDSVLEFNGISGTITGKEN